MKRFRLSPEAARDIRESWVYVAEDSIPSARRLRLQIFDACQRLADHPGIGHSRPGLTEKPLLFWPVGSYLIIYKPTRPIEIVRVVHGARDIPSLV